MLVKLSMTNLLSWWRLVVLQPSMLRLVLVGSWEWCWVCGCVGRMVYRQAGVWWECMHEGGHVGVNMGKCAGRNGVWAGSCAWWNSTMRYMLEFRLLVTSLPTHVFLVTFDSVPTVHVFLLADIYLRFFLPPMHLSLHSIIETEVSFSILNIWSPYWCVPSHSSVRLVCHCLYPTYRLWVLFLPLALHSCCCWAFTLPWNWPTPTGLNEKWRLCCP